MLVAAIQTGAFALVGLALLGLFGVLAAVNRRGAALGWGTGRGARLVRLSPEHAVHVVELDGRRWLVGTGPGSAPAVLAELTPTSSADPSGDPVTAPLAACTPAGGPETSASSTALEATG